MALKLLSKTKPDKKEAKTDNALCVSTKELISKAEKLMCAGNEISGKPCEICVQFLTDGATTEYADISELFVSGEIGKSSKDVVFTHLPIVKNMVTYDEPLVLISDDYEIDYITAGRVSLRTEKAKAYTFPVVILSDEFFVLRRGEKFSYSFIIEALEKASGATVMAFKRGDISRGNEYVKSYTEYIGYTLALLKTKKYLDDVIAYLGEVAEYYSGLSKITERNAVKRLASMAKVKRICVFVRDELYPLYNELNEKTNEWSGVIVKLRERYDRYIDRLVMETPVLADSPFALNLDLKYGVFRSQIKGFIEHIKRSSVYSLPAGILDVPAEQCAGDSEKLLSSQTCELTLLGTFSSGKTTMINTLLGHEKKLRTSMAHNTAVLMNIMYSGENGREHYDIVYKDKVIWDLIKPNSFDKDVINPFNAKAKVIGIEKNDGNNTVTLLDPSKGEKRRIDIRGSLTLNVSVGDVIQPGQSLVKRSYSLGKLLIASKRELETILEYIEKNKLTNFKITCFISSSTESSMITGTARKSENRVLSSQSAVNFIKRLLTYEAYSMSNDSTHRIVDADKVFAHMNVNVSKAEFRADVKLDNRSALLDESGWLELCGSTDANTSDTVEAFSEAPSCYMFVSRLDLYLKSEFLENCTVNDTPGFGSVTEEHDACTERFISTNRGRLLVMISINSKTEDAKLADLLNYLANIYRSFHKERISEVYFMLNVFVHSAPNVQLERVCNRIVEGLVKRGFEKNNIFACDLKSAIDGGQHMKTMFGIPSYDVFKQKCITEMVEAGVRKKYLDAYNIWEGFFARNTNSIDDRIINLRQALIDRERRVAELKDSISRVRNTYMKSIDGVLDEARGEYDRYFHYINAVFRGNSRGARFLLLERKRRAECRNVIGQIRGLIRGLNDYEDTIKTYANTSFDELEYIIKSWSSSEKVPEPHEVLFTLAIENIASKLDEADEKTRAWNKDEYTENYMGVIKSMIDDDCKRSAEKARNYYNSVKMQFERRKSNIIAGLERELRQIGSPELIREEIERLEGVLSDLESYKSLFNRSVNAQDIRRS